MFIFFILKFEGTPCAVRVARTVWSGGKDGDYIKVLPITIGQNLGRIESAFAWLDVQYRQFPYIHHRRGKRLL